MEKIINACNGYSELNNGLNISNFKKQLISLFPDDINIINSLKRKELEITYINKVKYYKITNKISDEISNTITNTITITNTNKLIILIGLQGSGKTTYAHELMSNDNMVIVSRDKSGGTIKSLVVEVRKLLLNHNVILDNTNLTQNVRDYFNEFNPEYIYLDSPFEDCQIRILHRMYENGNQIYMTGTNNSYDPHIFPIKVLYSARKMLELPKKFTRKIVGKYIFDKSIYTNKALFLDIDGTLRKTDHLENKYPINTDEIIPAFNLMKMKEILNKYITNGYILIGISNQSGIHKKIVSEEMVNACFNKTKEMLEVDFPILYCPHQSFPISCYCRKPNVGNFVLACEQYKISPHESIFVGDMKTDETTANNMNIKYIHSNTFFNS